MRKKLPYLVLIVNFVALLGVSWLLRSCLMAKFMVTLQLPVVFTEDFVALIPRHRMFINQLIEEHVVEAYAISADRTQGWITMNGQSAEAIRQVVQQFPLYAFFTAVKINELFVFDSVSSRFPPISLN